MNELMSGLYFGKSLAEGDYLGAMPFFADVIKAVKTAAPNLIREVASRQLTKVQTRLVPAAPQAPTVPFYDAPAPVAAPNPWPRYLAYGALAVGAVVVIRRMRRGR